MRTPRCLHEAFPGRGSRAAAELAEAWVERDLAQVLAVGRRSIGLLSPCELLWPRYLLAEVQNDRLFAVETLKKLIVALPSCVEFHLLLGELKE